MHVIHIGDQSFTPHLYLGGLLALLLVAVAAYFLGRLGHSKAPVIDMKKTNGRSGASAAWKSPWATTPRPARAAVDLSKPIGPPEWVALGKLRGDARYKRDFGIVRARYQIVANPMLLSNTLKETMETFHVDLAEAVCLIANDNRIR